MLVVRYVKHYNTLTQDTSDQGIILLFTTGSESTKNNNNTLIIQVSLQLTLYININKEYSPVLNNLLKKCSTFVLYCVDREACGVATESSTVTRSRPVSLLKNWSNANRPAGLSNNVSMNLMHSSSTFSSTATLVSESTHNRLQISILYSIQAWIMTPPLLLQFLNKIDTSDNKDENETHSVTILGGGGESSERSPHGPHGNSPLKYQTMKPLHKQIPWLTSLWAIQLYLPEAFNE